ncbi:MAG: hypothetical protein HKN47_23285 [Pirellulaceae bacterium]|nr:hypothetical protein [Pirellulaceae bacterium]
MNSDEIPNHAESEHAESEQSENPAIDTDAVDASDQTAGTPSDNLSHYWAWLFVGLVAAILAVVLTKVMLSEFQAPLPDDYSEIVAAGPMGERYTEAEAMIAVNDTTNHGRLLSSLGVLMAVLFGWAAGFLNQRFVAGIIGALVAIVVAVPLGWFTAGPILELQDTAISSVGSGDIYAMLLHTLQWIVIGLPSAIAVGIGAGRATAGVKVAGGFALSALLAAVIYVIGGTLLDPSSSLANAQPQPGIVFYVWTCLTPMLCGVFLWRSKV